MSEGELRPKLDLPRLVRRARHSTTGRCVDDRVRRCEIDRVQQVERFGPQLDRFPTGHPEPLEQRRVDVPLMVRAQDACA